LLLVTMKRGGRREEGGGRREGEGEKESYDL
jgi:hypothetical protein